MNWKRLFYNKVFSAKILSSSSQSLNHDVVQTKYHLLKYNLAYNFFFHICILFNPFQIECNNLKIFCFFDLSFKHKIVDY